MLSVVHTFSLCDEYEGEEESRQLQYGAKSGFRYQGFISIQGVNLQEGINRTGLRVACAVLAHEFLSE